MAKTKIIEYESDGYQMSRPIWVNKKEWETDFKEGVEVRHAAEQSEKFSFVESFTDSNGVDIAKIVTKDKRERRVYLDMIVVKNKPKNEAKPKRKKSTKKKRK